MPLTAILKKKRLFRTRLLGWYDRHGRELPWRETRDPYRIWVSEVMLQQTRVNAVLGHYRRFLKTFPTVQTLASACEADVLAAWSGLGYYRRARMMREAAQKIVQEHAGRFPRTAEDLRTLPGIGRYTAAAIASIAYDEPRAVVDGNVERVVARIAGKAPSQAAIWDFVESIITPDRPGDFNQAMMELGATVCTPKNPDCVSCPVKAFCRSQGATLPKVKTPGRRVAIVRYIFSRKPGSILLVQRDKKASLMAGMWELPPARARTTPPLLRVRHSITTTNYEVLVYAGRVSAGSRPRGGWIPMKKILALPLTGLARKVLTRLGAIASPA